MGGKNDRPLRGGTFRDNALFVRSAYRYWPVPAYRNDTNFGFRPARTFR